jgi:4-hydroxy-2-oxoheptanedioate aldolase
MKKNRFREVVQSGRVPLGHMIWEFGTRGIAKVLESTDLDFVLIDMEHTGFDTERVADVIAWLKATDIAPFVRVPQRLYHFLARTMDAGALGVMVANVETPEQAREIVNCVKYAPLGNRGLGLGGAQNNFIPPDPIPYMQFSNENTTVICQIESVTGLQNCEAIGAVPGVDVLWVGHFDLTQSMGICGQFQHPQFLDALSTVVAAAKKNGKVAGIQPGSLEQARQWMGLGYNVISFSTDVGLYRSALSGAVNDLRALAASTSA